MRQTDRLCPVHPGRGRVIVRLPASLKLLATVSWEWNLSTDNASSSPLTLKIMLIVVLLFVSVVLAYQIWAYRLFSLKETDNDLAHQETY